MASVFRVDGQMAGQQKGVLHESVSCSGRIAKGKGSKHSKRDQDRRRPMIAEAAVHILDFYVSSLARSSKKL